MGVKSSLASQLDWTLTAPCRQAEYRFSAPRVTIAELKSLLQVLKIRDIKPSQAHLIHFIGVQESNEQVKVIIQDLYGFDEYQIPKADPLGITWSQVSESSVRPALFWKILGQSLVINSSGLERLVKQSSRVANVEFSTITPIFSPNCPGQIGIEIGTRLCSGEKAGKTCSGGGTWLTVVTTESEGLQAGNLKQISATASQRLELAVKL